MSNGTRCKAERSEVRIWNSGTQENGAPSLTSAQGFGTISANMRDTHEGMPELVAAYERSGLYFGSVRVTIGGESRVFEFGVPIEDYKALRSILQTCPFERLPGIQYHYFIVPSIGRNGEHHANIEIRIEQGRNGRQVPFKVPLLLGRNLYWFAILKDFKDADHLHVVGEATSEG